jgi:effector-binding domain-containing protein
MKSLTFRTSLAIVVFFVFHCAAFSQGEPAQKFEIKEIGIQKTLILTMTVPSSQISQKMGEAYGKLFAYLGQKGITPTGAPFAVYKQYDPKGNTTFDAGVPVPSKVEGSGDMVYREYPAMKVLSTLYIGAYAKVEPVYGAMIKYMKDNGLKTSNVAWGNVLNRSQPGEKSGRKSDAYLFSFTIVGGWALKKREWIKDKPIMKTKNPCLYFRPLSKPTLKITYLFVHQPY